MLAARRLAAVAGCAAGLLGALAGSLVVLPGVAAAGAGSDRTTIHRLEQRIAGEGARTQALVARYDAVVARLAAIDRRIAADSARLRAERLADRRATAWLRHVAVAAYVSASSGGTGALSAASGSMLAVQQVYVDAAGGSLESATTAVVDARHRSFVLGRTLAAERASTLSTLAALRRARAAADLATSADETLLGHVRRQLLALVALANQQREQAAERALAAQAASLATAGPISPPSRPAVVTPGSYADPFRAVSALSPERIDQGVDYSGFGPVYALGDGVVLSTVNGGWPGGTFITYRLTDGPAQGLVVYVAEDLNPTVQVGETVTPTTVIGQMYEGPDGIETGWADPTGDGNTMAADYGQFNGWNVTAFGANFSQLLQSLGAPGGVADSAVAGALPSSWPSW